jgi:hypothetical protein
MRKQLAVVLAMCQRCSRPCAYTVVKVRRWLTFCFIPLFPVGTKYFTVYSMCAGAMSIAREQAERLEQEAVRQSSELCFQDGVRALLGKSPQNFLGGRSKTPRPFEISVGWV